MIQSKGKHNTVLRIVRLSVEIRGLLGRRKPYCTLLETFENFVTESLDFIHGPQYIDSVLALV